MSIELKFRVWDKTSESMLYQDDFERVELDTKNKMVTLIAEEESDKSHYVLDYEDGIEAEIMQYTGLKDKNGKKIYEGDILRKNIKYILNTREFKYTKECLDRFLKDGEGNYYYLEYRFFEIRWDNETARFIAYEHSTGEEISFDDVMFLFLEEDFEVIGNIYENPELLEGEE
ncbi:YopX family protein [Clostridium perfringens]|uniref:YopX family protein n=1 Tax=Clostridium perfringens TaxID=1502 RepID=UPI0024BCB769|nr:YopX family protein [Clostridium perfringens]